MSSGLCLHILIQRGILWLIAAEDFVVREGEVEGESDKGNCRWEIVHFIKSDQACVIYAARLCFVRGPLTEQ